jgi:mediator of RNA polymerase II transcription subunit 31
MAESANEGPVVDEERIKNRKRFELELEFVQALANPFYLHSLAQQGILYQPAFINYLKYLLYWKEKGYARFILCVSCYFGTPTSFIFTLAGIHMHCIT